MRATYRDAAKLEPLDRTLVLEWGAQRRHCVAVTPIAAPEDKPPKNHIVVARFVTGGAWHRVFLGCVPNKYQ